MAVPQPGGFWDLVRSWADSAGLLRPLEDPTPGARPPVPESVCASCPICQAAATLEQVDAEALGEIADLARGVVEGLSSALASAAEQRIGAHPRSVEDDEAPDAR